MNNKLNNLLLTLIAIISHPIFGQDTLNIATKPVKIIKFDITGLMGDQVTNSSGIQLGLEYEINNRFSFEQDIMYFFKFDGNKNKLSQIECENINGIKLATEIRYYIKKEIEPKFTDFYLASNLILKYSNAERKEANNDGEYNYYKVNRFAFALHCKMGLQFSLYKNFFLDLSFGTGARFITSSSADKRYNGNNETEFLSGKIYDNGNTWNISLTGGIKFGYKF